MWSGVKVLFHAPTHSAMPIHQKLIGRIDRNSENF